MTCYNWCTLNDIFTLYFQKLITAPITHISHIECISLLQVMLRHTSATRMPTGTGTGTGSIGVAGPVTTNRREHAVRRARQRRQVVDTEGRRAAVLAVVVRRPVGTVRRRRVELVGMLVGMDGVVMLVVRRRSHVRPGGGAGCRRARWHRLLPGASAAVRCRPPVASFLAILEYMATRKKQSDPQSWAFGGRTPGQTELREGI